LHYALRAVPAARSRMAATGPLAWPRAKPCWRSALAPCQESTVFRHAIACHITTSGRRRSLCNRVKFRCGAIPPNAFMSGPHEGPVKLSNYLTALNVHNPNGWVVTIQKKAVLLFRACAPPPPKQPQPPSQLMPLELPPD